MYKRKIAEAFFNKSGTEWTAQTTSHRSPFANLKSGMSALSLFILISPSGTSACEAWSEMSPHARDVLLHELKSHPDDYALVIRHADKTPVDEFEASSDTSLPTLPDYCSGSSPPLTEQGINHAQMIAKGIIDYGLEIGSVLTSPVCRAHQTAEVAFGTDNITLTEDTQLRLEGESRRISLRNKINAKSDNGLNVLIAHSSEIASATKVEPACGETLVVEKTRKSKQSICKTRILPDEWMTLNSYHASEDLWAEPDLCASDAISIRSE